MKLKKSDKFYKVVFVIGSISLLGLLVLFNNILFTKIGFSALIITLFKIIYDSIVSIINMHNIEKFSKLRKPMAILKDGTIDFIVCENIETEEDFMNLVEEINKKGYLQLKGYNEDGNLRFTRVSEVCDFTFGSKEDVYSKLDETSDKFTAAVASILRWVCSKFSRTANYLEKDNRQAKRDDEKVEIEDTVVTEE